MNLRLARPEVVVDPRRVPGLRDITVAARRRRDRGHGHRHRAARAPRGGRGAARGSSRPSPASATPRSATAPPSAARSPTPTRPSELPAVLAGVEGEVVLRSATGERRVGAADFFDGSFSTDPTRRRARHRGPLPGARPGATGWDEIARRPGDFALAGLFASVAVDGGLGRRRARLAVQRPRRPTGARRRRRGGPARPRRSTATPSTTASRPSSPRSPPPTTATPRAATARRSPPPSCAGCSPASPPDPDPPPPEAELHAVTEHPDPTRTVTIRVDGTERTLAVEGPHPPLRRAAPRRRAHRHPRRLRAGRVRRLHGGARRPGGAVVPDAGGAGRRCRDRHDRGRRPARARCTPCRRRCAPTTASSAGSAPRAS